MSRVHALGYGSFVPVCVYSGAPGWDIRPLAKTPTLAHGYASDHLSSRDAWRLNYIPSEVSSFEKAVQEPLIV